MSTINIYFYNISLYLATILYLSLSLSLSFFIIFRIEIDEQISKPLNLANSAVLRAVEEEEQQIKCGR